VASWPADETNSMLAFAEKLVRLGMGAPFGLGLGGLGGSKPPVAWLYPAPG
jgi:hypothetical protein